MDERERELRRQLAAQLRREIDPLLDADNLHGGGYNCCGCDTYRQILDHAIRIVTGPDHPE